MGEPSLPQNMSSLLLIVCSLTMTQLNPCQHLMFRLELETTTLLHQERPASQRRQSLSQPSTTTKITSQPQEVSTMTSLFLNLQKPLTSMFTLLLVLLRPLTQQLLMEKRLRFMVGEPHPLEVNRPQHFWRSAFLS